MVLIKELKCIEIFYPYQVAVMGSGTKAVYWPVSGSYCFLSKHLYSRLVDAWTKGFVTFKTFCN